MTTVTSPRDDLADLIYPILWDGAPHLDEYSDSPEWSWRLNFNDKRTVVSMIKNPTIEWASSRKSEEQEKIKIALQYFLNVDEKVPYVLGSFSKFPELQEKVGSKTSRAFASYQDTSCPLDSYALCEWLWEILYGEEDWHTDISSWVVTE
jgi:hypothetical protein